MSSSSALIVTCYIYKNERDAQQLAAHLRATHSFSESDYKKERDAWLHETDTTKTALLIFQPPIVAAHDTWVIQLALQENGEATTVWPRLRKRVGIGAIDLPPTFIGYTLTYYAMITDDSDAESTTTALMSAVDRLPGATTDRACAKIGQMRLEGGMVTLVAAPGDDGLGAAIIYLAVGIWEPTSSNPLTLLFLGAGAKWLMPDLIAHKSYVEQRKMGTAWREAYNTQIDALRREVQTLLKHHPSGKGGTKEYDIEPLSHAYEALFGELVRIDAYRISLTQQYEHYRIQARALAGGTVLQHHENDLFIAMKDLEMLTGKGQKVLDAAGTTITIARTQQEKQRGEERTEERERLGWLIAGVGCILAIPQLITWDVVCGWLLRVGWVTHCEQYLALRPFVIQLTVILIGIIFLLLWWFRSGTRRD